MRKRVLVLHAYSASNAGDGLLVTETVRLVREAFGAETSLTILASQPETFSHIEAEIYPSIPTIRGWDRRYLHALRSIDDFDFVVAVGGGYLRAGTAIEAVKTLLVHGPQLRAAARSSAPTAYLPQSVGPVRFGLRRAVERRLAQIGSVMLRDDRSMTEFTQANPVRLPDLATVELDGPGPIAPDPVPVLSVRSVHGKVPSRLFTLAEALGTYDQFVQSTTSGNDDRPATAEFVGRSVLSREQLLDAGAEGFKPRVVIAVRLHAALMALRAGHYVVHLAYERKGFGAFTDLGISEYVHSVNHFDVDAVLAQIITLRDNPDARSQYRQGIAATHGARSHSGDEILRKFRALAEGERR